MNELNTYIYWLVVPSVKSIYLCEKMSSLVGYEHDHTAGGVNLWPVLSLAGSVLLYGTQSSQLKASLLGFKPLAQITIRVYRIWCDFILACGFSFIMMQLNLSLLKNKPRTSCCFT